MPCRRKGRPKAAMADLGCWLGGWEPCREQGGRLLDVGLERGRRDLKDCKDTKDFKDESTSVSEVFVLAVLEVLYVLAVFLSVPQPPTWSSGFLAHMTLRRESP